MSFPVRMETSSHTFPLPEPETHKLDGVTEDLRHQPGYVRARDFIVANAWPSVCAAFVAGVVVGAALKLAR